MGNTIIIDDGLKTYDIKNKEGKLLGQFSFNPSDINMVKRYNQAVDDFEKMFTDMSKTEESDMQKLLIELDEKVCEKINFIFNSDVSENFFGIMGAFSPLADGRFFLESVLDAIGQAIKNETGERVKKMQNKIKKHTSKYHN